MTLTPVAPVVSVIRRLRERGATLVLIGLWLGVVGSIPSELYADAQVPTFARGQRWEYRAPPGTRASTLLIVKADSEDDGVVFVDVENLDIDGEPGTLTFIPMTEAALRRSVTKLLKSDKNTFYLDRQYSEWQDLQSKGISYKFDTDVSTALATVLARRKPSSVSSTRANPSELDGGTTSEEINAQISRYNEAVRLSNVGQGEEALELLDALLEECADEGWCYHWRQTTEELRAAVEHKRYAAGFNEAVELANSGKHQQAIAILKELKGLVVDPDLAQKIDHALQQLGS